MKQKGPSIGKGPFLMRKTFLLISPALLIATSVSASDPGEMSAAEFLARAEKLEKKGMLAAFSGDLKTLKREAKAAGQSYRARIKADRAAGRQPHSCPPEGEQSMSSNELLGHLRSYPEATRKEITMKAAFADLMKKRYPCG